MGSRVGRDREREAFDRQLGERDPLKTLLSDLRARNPGGVEGDVDAPCLLDHRRQMLFDSLLVEGVDLRGFGQASFGGNKVWWQGGKVVRIKDYAHVDYLLRYAHTEADEATNG
jgi:hypothetical protein